MELNEIYVPKEVVSIILSFVEIENLRDYRDLYSICRTTYYLMRKDQAYSKLLFNDQMVDIVNRFDYDRYFLVPLTDEKVKNHCVFNEYVHVRESIEFEKRVYYFFKRPIEFLSYLNVIMLNMMCLIFPIYLFYAVLTLQLYNIFLYFFYSVFIVCSLYYFVVAIFYLIVFLFHTHGMNDKKSLFGFSKRQEEDVIRKCFRWKGFLEIMLSFLQLYLFYSFQKLIVFIDAYLLPFLFSLFQQHQQTTTTTTSDDLSNQTSFIWMLKHILPLILVLLNEKIKMKPNVFFLTFLYSCWIDKDFKYRNLTNWFLNIYNVLFLMKHVHHLLFSQINSKKQQQQQQQWRSLLDPFLSLYSYLNNASTFAFSSSFSIQKKKKIFELCCYFVLCGIAFGCSNLVIVVPLNVWLIFYFFYENLTSVLNYGKKMVKQAIMKKYFMKKSPSCVDLSSFDEKDFEFMFLNQNEILKKKTEEKEFYGEDDDGLGSYEKFYLKMLEECIEKSDLKEKEIKIFFFKAKSKKEEEEEEEK